MPADLSVVGVKLPSPLVAPCPATVIVTVTNIGTDPADPGDFDVTIEISGVGDTPASRFETIVVNPEDQRLGPGRTIDVTVRVKFPCASPVTLRATADLRGQIANNLRSAPTQTFTALTPKLTPWLTVSVRVGIRDAAGHIMMDPDAVCPGKPLVAMVTIENQGCTVSQPSTTRVTLEDVSAVPPGILTAQSYLTPALLPGQSDVQWLSFATPAPSASPSILGVRVNGDAKMDNPDQCDRASLNAWIARPVSAGGPPRLALTVGGAGVIRPGEVPALSWSVRNECTDIGAADVRILFGTPATELYRTQVSMPLQSLIEEQLAPARITIPPAIATTFWTVGLKSLELEVTGLIGSVGPYRLSVPLNVIPEAVDDTWWTWAAPPSTPAAPSWKSSYAITGSFVNRGLAAMTVTALSALEHPTDVVGTAQDATAPPLTGVFAAPVAPGGTVAARFPRFQGWTWLSRGTFVEVGPRSRTFSYVATVSVVDGFGNVYTSIVSAATTTTVTVAFTKTVLHGFAIGLLAAGLAMLATAAIVATGGGYAWIAAVMCAAFAMAMIITATFLLYDAYDPPIPDFRRASAALPDPRAWKIPVADDERLHALGTLGMLVPRFASAYIGARQGKARAWAAFLDTDGTAHLEHRGRTRDALDMLQRLVPATIAAADEAQETWAQLIAEVRSVPSAEQLRDATRRFATELGLTDLEQALVAERLAAIDDRAVAQAFEQSGVTALSATATLVRGIHEAIAGDFARYEYLR